MKITEKQVLMLFDILGGAKCISGFPLPYNTQAMNKLYDDIIEQQSNDLVDIKDTKIGTVVTVPCGVATYDDWKDIIDYGKN